MSRTYSETRNGIAVTVYLSPFSISQWCVIATKDGRLLKIPPIDASNRVDAARQALDIAEGL